VFGTNSHVFTRTFDYLDHNPATVCQPVCTVEFVPAIQDPEFTKIKKIL
jgi:hypothetical protein